jgi:hypothetical protein
MKVIVIRPLNRLLLLAVFLGASPSAFARLHGGISDGGGSTDAASGQIVDTYLESHRFSTDDPKSGLNLAYGGGEGDLCKEQGLSKIFSAGLTPLLFEAGTELNGLAREKAWYEIPFDRSILKKVSLDTKQKLIESGFLRGTNQVALQTPNIVLIDQNYFEAQVKKIKSGNLKLRIEGCDNVVTLVLHEMVRAMEIKSRKLPGETDEQAIGKGGYRRYGMPPMTEDNVLAVTVALKRTPIQVAQGSTGDQKSNPNYDTELQAFENVLASDLADTLAANNYGYYLSTNYLWGTFNPRIESINAQIKKACGNKSYGDVEETLLEMQAITRSELIGDSVGSNRENKVTMEVRVEYFDFLNSFLAATDSGRLKHFEDKFPQGEDTGKQICRAMQAADWVDKQPPKPSTDQSVLIQRTSDQ